MRFYLILFFCVSVVFTSCKDDRKIPANVIPEHEMAELLTDIHIIDGSLYEVVQVPDSLTKHGLAMYINVFRIHHVDTTLFNKSLKFYSTRPDLIDEIYGGIAKRLQKKIDSLQKHKPKEKADTTKKAAEKKKADSLKKAEAEHKLAPIQKVTNDQKVKPLKKLTPQVPMAQVPFKLDPKQKLPKANVTLPVKTPVKKQRMLKDSIRERLRRFRSGMKPKLPATEVVKPQN